MTMSTDDDSDLKALREFRGALDEPPEGALARGRYRMASSEDRPRKRRQWLLAPIGAAAALAVVLGAAAALEPGNNEQGQAPAEKPSAQATTAAKEPDLPVTKGIRAPVNAKVSSDGGATHAKAVAAMDRLAGAAANARPMEVGADRVLYVKTYNLVPDAGSYVHEVWMDPLTMVPLRIRRTDGGQQLDDTSTQEEIDKAAAEPSNLYRPDVAYLRHLPTDPGQLIAAWRQWAQGQYPGRSADGMIWKDTFELMNYSEPFWTADERATIYQALAKMPDVKATGATIDGRPYDMVCMDREPDGGGTVDCTLFDTATGRYAGSALPGKNLKLTTENVNLVDYGTQPRPIPAIKEK
ncbi:hypothetical protein ACQP00_48430 [Dactylosporangium sp. CS-047395]|uniref:hypothetical protein n=1 Tax=Dactylosporangium sp. CS-047395 TaxID=3239936 RepID=UPI003D8D3632